MDSLSQRMNARPARAAVLSGKERFNETDVSFPVLGQSLYLERSYSAGSRDTSTSTLGYGWTHNPEVSLLLPENEPGTVIIKGCRGSRFRFSDRGEGEFAPWPGVWATLTRTTTTTYTYTLTGVDQTKYIFDEMGRLVEIRAPEGPGLTYSYTNQHLTRVADATGERDLDFKYDDQGRLVRLRDPLNRMFTYGYSASGDLVMVTDPRGLVSTYIYTGTHLLSEVRNPAGHLVEKTAYDAEGRAVKQWTSLSDLPLIIDYGDTVVITDAMGHRTEDVYAGAGTLAAQSREGVTETRTYDDNLNWMSTTDANDHRTYYDFNRMGLPKVITDALGVQTRITYDSANHPTRFVDDQGHATTYAYEGNLLITTTDALSGTVVNTYNDEGLSIQTVAKGITTTYSYNAWGQRVAVTDTTGLVYTYNAAGLRVGQAVDSDQTEFAWDWATGVPELLSDGDVLYLVGHDTLGHWDGDAWQYPLPDALGSVRQTVDASAAIVATREWTPYGVEVGGAQAGLGFTSEWFDADMGLQYLRARW